MDQLANLEILEAEVHLELQVLEAQLVQQVLVVRKGHKVKQEHQEILGIEATLDNKGKMDQ